MDPTLAQVIMFAGNFAPLGWAFCQGQLMSIAQNTALFSLLGTTYGGDGQTTFGLPDFRSRNSVGTGQGPGLSNITLGELAGTASVTMQANNLPPHNHTVGAVKNTPNAGNANGTMMANGSFYQSGPADINMNAAMIGPGPGISAPISIENPYLGMNFIICVEGIYPSRN